VRSESFVDDITAVADVYQAQLRHGLSVASNNVLTGGASYRYATVDSAGLIGGREDQGVFTVFLQDEWNLRDNLIATLGIGMDVHSEAGARASPRGSLVYSPWQNHTFRVSIARAYRNPSFLENFEMLPLRVLPPPPPSLPQTFTVFGNTDLKPAEMLSYEFGYQTLLFERLRVRLELFYNDLDKVIVLEQPVFATISPRLPPVQIGSQFVNSGDAQIYGGEIGFDVYITPWLRGFLNYSYQERVGPISPQDPTSHHKGNAGLNFAFTNGMSATVLLHHVGEPESNASGVKPYTLVNLRVGYRFKLFERDAELAVQAFNLFDDVHREFPRGDLIERRVSGTIRYRF
jgi:iron complex outermembrane recepter protein